MDNNSIQKQRLRLEAIELIGDQIPTSDPRYEAVVQDYVDNNIQTVAEPNAIQKMAVDAAEYPYDSKPRSADGSAGLSGALQSVADITTRGIPEKVALAMQAMGLAPEWTKEALTNVEAANQYAKSASENRVAQHPVSSFVGSAVPDLIAGAMLPGPQTPRNAYRVLSGAEKMRGAVRSGLTAFGAGALGTGLRYTGSDTIEDAGIEALKGGGFGIGGDMLGRAGMSAVNWAKNAKNKAPVDLEVQRLRDEFLPPGMSPNDRLGEYNSLKELTQRIEDNLKTRGGALFEDVQTSGAGPDMELPPSRVQSFAALARDKDAPGSGNVDGGTAYDPLNIPSESTMRELDRVVQGGKGTYADRVDAISALKQKSAILKSNPGDTSHQLIDDMTRSMQQELDDYVVASGSPQLMAIHDMQRNAMDQWGISMEGLQKDSKTGVRNWIDEGFPEKTLREDILHPSLGVEADTFGRIIPGSKPLLSSMWIREHVGKTPGLGDSTASQVHLGNNDEINAFLSNLDRKDTVSGAARSFVNRHTGWGVDKGDLAFGANTMIARGKKPAQQYRNSLASALRGILAAELGRYQPSDELVLERLNQNPGSR